MIPHRSTEHEAFSVTLNKSNRIISYLSSGALLHLQSSYELMYVSDIVIFGGYGEGYGCEFLVDEFGKYLYKIIVSDRDVTLNTEDVVWIEPTVIFTNNKTIVEN